jgi:pilus assembly protein CpaE
LIILVGVEEDFEQSVRDAIPGDDVRVRSGDALDTKTVQAIAAQGPAVVVLGSLIDERRAFEAAGRFDREHPGVSVLIVTDPEPDTWRKAVAVGVRGIIEPGAKTSALKEAFAAALKAAGRVPPRTDQPEGSRGSVITAVSPKGGAGKTVISSNLAVAIAAHAPRDVVLVDLDLQFGDVAYALMLSPSHTMLDAVSALREHDVTTLKVFLTPHPSGIFALCAPEDPATVDDITPADTAEVLRALSAEFSYVVVDTGGGIGEHALTAIEESTDIVLISDMDVPSVRNLRKAVDVLDLLGMTANRRHFVLNRADSRVGLSTDDVASVAGMRIDLELPSSRQVPVSLNEGRPLMARNPRSPVARRIAELAGRIIEASWHRAGSGGRA